MPSGYNPKGIEELDNIREEISRVINQNYPNLIIDIIFPKDAKWAEDIIVREK